MKNKVKVIISGITIALTVTFIILSLTLPVYNTDVYKLPGIDANGNTIIGTNTATHCGTLSYYLGDVIVGLAVTLYAFSVAINGLSVVLNVTDKNCLNFSFFTGVAVFAFSVFILILTFVLAATGNFFCY